VPGPLPGDAAALAASLVAFFHEHKRAMPWRTIRSAYRVWISEIMLQQTQVATATPYFERFVAAFPSVHALAEADLSDVLSQWSGLGYYSRARNLHRAAQMVIQEWSGRLPSTAAELQELPGIGRYTAGAIASIAHGEWVSVVDGNVARVLSRLVDLDLAVDGKEGKSRVEDLAQRLVEGADNPGDLNEALMELGALVCTPRNPSCHRCPWRDLCVALEKGTVDLRPVKKPRKERTQMQISALVLQVGDAVALEEGAAQGLYGGLRQCPSILLPDGVSAEQGHFHLLDRLALPPPDPFPAGVEVKRVLTHRELRIHGVGIRLKRRPPGLFWAPLSQLDSQPISAATRALLAALPP
jgi:A/G-specific adenine glycosylase